MNTPHFAEGTYQFNSEPNINFQLNRAVTWSGGDPDEVREAAKRIHDTQSCAGELLKLAEKAEREGRIDPAIA